MAIWLQIRDSLVLLGEAQHLLLAIASASTPASLELGEACSWPAWHTFTMAGMCLDVPATSISCGKKCRSHLRSFWVPLLDRSLHRSSSHEPIDTMHQPPKRRLT